MAEATRVTDGMFLAAAKALAACLPDATLREGGLYPPIGQVRRVSKAVATAVFAQAVAEGVAEPVVDMEATIDSQMWTPEYSAPYRPL